MRKMTRIALLCAGCLATTIAASQGRPTPDQAATRYRQSLMVVMQGLMQPLALMARNRAPYDASTVTRDAERLAVLAGMVPEAFERDTSTAANVTSEAAPGLWKEKTEFNRLANESKTRLDQLLAAAKSGNEAAVKTAITNVGSSCSGCHDKYRME